MPIRPAKVFARWLTNPHLGVHLAILAVVLCLPALWLGWQLDDHTYPYVLSGQSEEGMSPFRAFTLLEGDPEINHDLIDRGVLPW